MFLRWERWLGLKVVVFRGILVRAEFSAFGAAWWITCLAYRAANHIQRKDAAGCELIFI